MRVRFSLVFSLIVLSGIDATMPAFAQMNSAQVARSSSSACNIAALSQEIRQNPRNTNAYITRAACYLIPRAGCASRRSKTLKPRSPIWKQRSNSTRKTITPITIMLKLPIFWGSMTSLSLNSRKPSR